MTFTPPDSSTRLAIVVGSQDISVVVNNRRSSMAASYDGVAPSGGVGDPNFGLASTTVYLPLLFKNYNNWNTSFAVQNTGSSDAYVTVTYRRSNGPSQWTETASISPGAAHVFDQQNGPMPEGSICSAVVTSDQPVAVVVEERNSNQDTAMSYNGFSSGSTTVRTPLLFKNYNDWNTGIQVQNLDDDHYTYVTVTYYRSNGPGGPWYEYAWIGPGQSHTFYQPANPDLPDGFIGSAVVTSSGQPIVALVNETNYTRGVAMTYNGFGEGGTRTIYTPSLHKGYNYNDRNSGVQVQNVGWSDTTVTIRYYFTNGNLADTDSSPTISPGESWTFYLPANPDLPAGRDYSAMVTAGQAIMAIVNETHYGQSRASTYNGFNR